MVGNGGIESPVAANPNGCSAVFQNGIGGFGTGPRGFLDGRRIVRRYAVDLRGMKNGVVFQDANCLPAVIGFVVVNLKGLAEKNRAQFLALANLPLFVVRLLIGHPTWIAGLKS